MALHGSDMSTDMDSSSISDISSNVSLISINDDSRDIIATDVSDSEEIRAFRFQPSTGESEGSVAADADDSRPGGVSA